VAATAAVGFGLTSQSLEPVPVRCLLGGGGLKGLVRVRGGLPKLSSAMFCALTRGPAVEGPPPGVCVGPAQQIGIMC